MMMKRGIRITALKRLVYQLKCNALPLTTSRAFLMTTECNDVMAEEVTPKNTPRRDTGMASRKTPQKKPRVTQAQATRMRREGLDLRIM